MSVPPPSKRRAITCRTCGQVGHNSNNRKFHSKPNLSQFPTSTLASIPAPTTSEVIQVDESILSDDSGDEEDVTEVLPLVESQSERVFDLLTGQMQINTDDNEHSADSSFERDDGENDEDEESDEQETLPLDSCSSSSSSSTTLSSSPAQSSLSSSSISQSLLHMNENPSSSLLTSSLPPTVSSSNLTSPSPSTTAPQPQGE